ncbi:prolyl-tRNA synthetase-like protein [Paraphoma chrysanthemicola]|nr:prolyl-tRNA synthetase-like protein [Paraphoma chrysanthemicola]
MPAPIWRAALRPCILNSRSPALKSGFVRFIATDQRHRLSNFWAPTGGLTPQDGEQDESHALLVRGGFLRQAHSGVFHLLPLGLRVQNKVEALIDKHMSAIGASKTSLSSITTESLWRRSGRYSANSELLRIEDRRESGFLLSPTHEEEITALVASMVHSYKDLPLRLYQVGRKYRDERRPRQGLLRAKEFMMKDLYTFDSTPEAALETYAAVRQAYNNLFDELRLPYLVADADSGNMGGKLSHEYHFVSPKGEDNVWSCDSCTYVANEELVEKKTLNLSADAETVSFPGISTDRKTAYTITIPKPTTWSKTDTNDWETATKYLNLHALKKALPEGCEIDTGIASHTLSSLISKATNHHTITDRTLSPSPTSTSSHDLTSMTQNSPCPRCSSGHITSHRAIEIGHTFHLGTRYSTPLNANIALPDAKTHAPMEMGCHGIGVSRLIGAIASLLADEKGLNWPRCIAPWDVVVLTPPGHVHDAETVYDVLRRAGDVGGGDGGVDVVLDDRVGKSLGWKFKDADLIGYPVVVVLGREWEKERKVEIQCRRLGIKTSVEFEGIRKEVVGLLEKL